MKHGHLALDVGTAVDGGTQSQGYCNEDSNRDDIEKVSSNDGEVVNLAVDFAGEGQSAVVFGLCDFALRLKLSPPPSVPVTATLERRNCVFLIELIVVAGWLLWITVHWGQSVCRSPSSGGLDFCQRDVDGNVPGRRCHLVGRAVCQRFEAFTAKA